MNMKSFFSRMMIVVSFFLLVLLIKNKATSAENAISYEERAQEEYYQGRMDFRHKEYNKALEQLRKVVKEFSKSEIIDEVYVTIGEIKLLQKKNAEAIAAFKSSLFFNPASLSTTQKLIDVQFEQEKYEEVILYLKKLVIANKEKSSRDKKLVISFLDKVRDKYWRKDLYKKEMEIMDLITDNFPDTTKAAEIWLRKGNTYGSRPFTEMKKALYTYGNEWEKHFPYLRKAILCYEEVLKRFPHLKDKCSEAAYEIGFIYYRAKQYGKAKKYFSLVEDKFPHKSYYLNTLRYLAEIYTNLGDYKSLKIIKMKMLSSGVPSGDLYMKYAETCRKFGWIEESKKFFKKAVTEYPGAFGLPDEDILWIDDFANKGKTSLGLGNLHGDGNNEVVYVCNQGIFALEGKGGKIIWESELDTDMKGNIVLGDLDGDSLDDIVLATTKDIRAIRGKDGVALWKVSEETSSFGPSFIEILLGNFGGTTLDVAIVTKTGKVHCLNGKEGTTRWVYPNYPYISESSLLVAGDVNLDGVDDIVVNSHSPKGKRELVLLNGANGRPLWKFGEYEASYFSNAVICHYNQDSIPDIIATVGTTLLVLDGKNGKKLWELGGYESRHKLMLADINADQKHDILLVRENHTSVFFDLGRKTSFLVSVPCNFFIPVDYATRDKSWTIVKDTFRSIRIHKVFPRPYSNVEITHDLKKRFEDKFKNYNGGAGGAAYDIPPVIGDINGDEKLDLIVSIGRLVYALKLNIPCTKNKLAWPMAGLNHQHNLFLE